MESTMSAEPFTATRLWSIMGLKWWRNCVRVLSDMSVNITWLLWETGGIDFDFKQHWKWMGYLNKNWWEILAGCWEATWKWQKMKSKEILENFCKEIDSKCLGHAPDKFDVKSQEREVKYRFFHWAHGNMEWRSIYRRKELSPGKLGVGIESHCKLANFKLLVWLQMQKSEKLMQKYKFQIKNMHGTTTLEFSGEENAINKVRNRIKK